MSSLEQSSEEQLDHGSSEDNSREEGLNAESVTTKLNLLQKELESFTAEIKMLRTTPQRWVVSLLSDAQVAMYTGISKMLFDSLLDWLSPALGKQVHDSPRGCSPNVSLSNSQKLLLLLMCLRQNVSQEDLAFRFVVDQSTVSRILNQWVPFMAYHMSSLIKWPQTAIGPTDPPYDHLPNTVAIIDGTEIFREKPSVLSTQKSTYSEYKSHTTIKYLVSCN